MSGDLTDRYAMAVPMSTRTIGRVQLTQPELPSRDDATDGPAPQLVTGIWRVFGEIRRTGITTLIVDRDYLKVLARSERAIVLQEGEVLLQGEAQDVARDPTLSSSLGA